MKSNRINLAILALLFFFLAFLTVGCGPSGSGSVPAGTGTGTGDTGDGDSGSGDEAATPSILSLSLSQTTVKSDNSDSAVVVATVLDENRAVIQGIEVVFSTNAGQLSGSTATTDTDGRSQIEFSSGTDNPTGQIVTITAEVEKLPPVQIQVQIIALVEPTVGTVEVTAGSASVVADGGLSSTSVTVTVRDTAGDYVDGIAVSLSTTAGTLVSETPTTINGVVTTMLTSPTLVGSATIRATVGGVSAITSITFVPGAAADIALSASPNSLTADGSSTSTIRASVLDGENNAVADGETITFMLSGSGTLSSQTATTTNGIATITYTAPTSGGTGSVSISAKATSGIPAPTPVSITLVETTVGTVEVATGSASVVADGISQTLVTVTVRDTAGNYIDDIAVSLSTTAGILVSETPTTTNGVATTMLTSPTLVGSATIRATVGGVSAITSITFVPGAAADIALSASPNSLTADGSSTSTIRATVLDANDNAVADGETITFILSGSGTLSSQTATTTNGTATTTYTAPTPTEIGPVSISAKATSGKFATTPVSITLVETTVATPDTLSLSLSQTTVKSDNSDSAVVVATVLDENRAVIQGVEVVFSTNAGQLSGSTATTDTDGRSQIEFSSGTDNPTNQIATITAEVEKLPPVQTPVQIIGSILTMTIDTPTITNDGSTTATLTITAENAQPASLYNVLITLITSGSGAVSLSADSGETNPEGKLKITVTGTNSGTVTIVAQGLGTTATQVLTVSPVGETLGISSPATDLYSLQTNANLTITVTAPNQNNVRFATTLGTLTGSVQTGPVIVEPVSGGVASVMLNSTKAGVATVQIYDADATEPVFADSLTVAISAPSTEADRIALQASSTVVAPSSGDVVNTASLVVTVSNANGQPVGGAPVAFSILNPIGDETISPVIVYTNNQGTASSTFTSGSLSSGALGVNINASVVGFSPAIEDNISIVIGGTPGSVVIGRGTTVLSINNDTAYQLPMSVLVADANGNPVQNAVVSLNAWPARYARGYWVEVEDNKCEAVITSDHTNEDIDKDLFLDANEDWNGDSELTPPNSAAGSLPDMVTTDENGLAQFDMVYTKSSAVWIKDEVSATVQVLGTETQSTYPFWLPNLVGEECNLSNSPYNRVGQSISLSASPNELIANGTSTSTIAVVVADSAGNAVADGEIVNFTATAGDIDPTQAGSQTVYSTTTVAGVALLTLTSPTTVGSGRITATYSTTSEEITVVFVPGPVNVIDLSASPNNLSADGSSTSTITVVVTDATGNIVVDGENIAFSITSGSGALSSLAGTTFHGRVATQYTASTTTGTITITAQSTNATTNTVNISLIAPIVGSVFTTTASTTVVADGASQSLIVATVEDANFNPITDGTTVTFSTTAGDLDNTQIGSQTTTTATTINGVATALLTSSTYVGSATVTATVGGVSSSTSVAFIPGAASTITLSATPSNITADGASTSTIRAVITDVFGNVVADGETITFKIASGLGVLSKQTATTFGGVATVNYTASTTAGTVTINVLATNGTSNTVNITLIAATIGSVSTSTGSTSIVADGVSQTVITSRVRDTAFNTVADGTTVTFTATAGDIDNATAGTQVTYMATTTNGMATATLTSPAIVGSSTVTATAGGVSGSTSVDFIPGAVSVISITATPNNLTADGASASTIKAMVTDANGNSVTNGETITFTLTGSGTLSSQTATTANGIATITYTASTAAGAVSISAKATNGVTAATAASITLVATSVGSVNVTTGSASLVADGASQTSITVTVRDSAGNNVADGTAVSLSTSAGTLASAAPTTTNGVATTMLTSPTIVGSATIRATVGGVSNNALVSFIPDVVNAITLTATPNNLTADGTATSTIKAIVTDANGNSVTNGETITFTLTGSGTLSSQTATTANGIATITYTASTAAGAVSISAKATNGVTAATAASITLVATSVGSVNVTTGSASLVADGASQTSITVTVRDSAGNNVADGTAVSLSTSAGTLASAAPTTTNGVATTMLTSPTIVGSATIRATVGGVSASTSVTFIPGIVNSILLTATPNNLTADGSSTSTIKALVKDSNGNVMSDGETISFNVTTGAGTLSHMTDTTTNGTAIVTYTSSSTAGTETVTAQATNGTTTSVDITLIAASIGTVTVSSSSTSILADGASQALITATVSDTSGNTVADGTTVTFATTTGDIDDATAGTQTTVTATTTGGRANATLTSSTISGAADITATAGGISDVVTVAFTQVPNTLTLSLSQISVKSDNSDTTTITATVLDANNAVIEGQTISFSASGGQISSTTAATDANGQGWITFSSGAADQTNQVVTVTATVTPLAPVQIPVQVTGSTLTLSTDNTALPDDGSSTASLTITAKDAGDRPVYDAALSLGVSGAGGANLSITSGNTDVSGELEATVTGTGAGAITITVTGLGTTGTQNYTVSTAGAVFGISAPATDPATLSVGSNLTVTVNAPTQANVRFAVTLGVWDGGSSSVVTKAVAGGTASAVLSSTLAGLATVQVFDAADSSTSDTLTVAISSPATDAAQLTLQADPSAVALSSGGLENTATLIATVRTSTASGSQAVGDAPVAFAITNPTGGGEKISPVVVFTDSSGVAETTFTSGSTSSGAEGVTINAWVVGEGTTGSLTNIISFNDANPDTITRSDGGDFSADGFEVGEQIRVQGSADNDGLYTLATVAPPTLKLIAADTLTAEAAVAGISVTITAIANTVDIIIGGTAGSVVIGRGTPAALNSTTYALPMSVLVADSNGNPVSGAVVSLSVWPVRYSGGSWYDEDPDADDEVYSPYISGTFDGEDANEDTFLDAGEDTNRDDELTPPNSAAGEVPVTVTTDDNGLANWNLTYLKESAVWIIDRIRASTVVLGTETTSTTTFRLPAEISEANSGFLPDSAYTIVLFVTEGWGNTVSYTFPVFRDSATDTYSAASSLAAFAGRVYTLTDDGTLSAGDVVSDFVTVTGDAITDSGATGTVNGIVPVEIIVE